MVPWLLAATLLAHPGDGWSNLKHVTRDRLYVVMLRDGQCQFGTLSSAGEQVLVLGTDSALGLAVKRSQILRVSDDLTTPSRTAVFSGRSSWQDVKAVAPTGTEYLRIVTKNGDEWKWRQPTVSADAISAEGTSLLKGDIREVFYVRLKPLDVDEEYLHEPSLKRLASVPLLGDLVAPKISVLVYDSDLPEDDSPLKCRLDVPSAAPSSNH